MTNKEQLCLSLSPFTIPELFETNLKQTIAPYLTEDRKINASKKYVFYDTEQIADRLFFLEKGIVMETLLNENGLEKNFLIFPPYLVGFNYCAHEQPIFPCTKAYTDCVVYAFTYAEIVSLMQSNRSLLKAIIKILALDFRMANSVALQNQSCSTFEKICQTILSYTIASTYNTKVQKLKMTQQLIAGLTGVHRISVVHAIQRLKEEKIVSYSNKALIVLDVDKIEQIAFGKYSIR